MSVTTIHQDNTNEHFSQNEQVSETQNEASTGRDTKNDHERWLRYNKLIEREVISKDYIEGGSKLRLLLCKMEDADWHIVLEEINNKEHPLRELDLRWRNPKTEPNEPGYIELVKAIGAHTTLIKFEFHINCISSHKTLPVLFEALKNNYSIKHISVITSEFDLETARAITQTLTNNQTLVFLGISAECPAEPPLPMPHESSVELARYLQATVLQRLRIYKIDDNQLKVLTQALPKTLVHLDLAHNNIGEDSIPILRSYLESNSGTLKELILDDNFATQYLQEQESSSLSTVKIIRDSSLEANFSRKEHSLTISPHEMNDSDWSMLFTELTKDDAICPHIELWLVKVFDRSHLKYFETLFGKQIRLKSLSIFDKLPDTSIRIELLRQLKQNNSITDLRLNFEMNSNVISELGNLLTNNDNIIRLNLPKSQNMSDEEAIMLAGALNTNTILQSFSLGSSEIGDIGFQALLSSLPNSLSQLELEDSLISEQSLSSLLAFVKTHPILKELSLKQSVLASSSSTEVNVPDLVEKILEFANENHCICKLNINEMFQKKMAESTSGEVDLFDVQLRDYHVLGLCNELKKDSNQNWSLGLKLNDRISTVGYRHLGDILSSAINIVQLVISGPINTSEEARATLLNGLCNNKTLKTFGIIEDKVNNQDVEYIRRFIQNNPALRKIVFYRCEIDTDGAACLAEVLPESSLEELDFDSNSLGDRGCASILSSIPPTLTKLSLDFNEITESSLRTILTFLATNRTLRTLKISCNPIFGGMLCAFGGENNNTYWQQAKQVSKQNSDCELT